MRHLPIVLLLALAPATAVASTPGQGPRPWDSPGDGASPTAVTKTLKCTVTEIQKGRTLVLYDAATEREYVVEVPPEVSLKSRARKLFDGRREIGFEDLAVGHELKVTYATAGGELLRIRVVGHTDELPG